MAARVPRPEIQGLTFAIDRCNLPDILADHHQGLSLAHRGRAHDNIRERLESGGYISSVDYDVSPAPAEALPIITFNDTISWHLNGEDIQFTHLASAHTDGDGIVWFKDSNNVHMGDTFLAGILPSVDVDSDGTIDGNTQIIPGHGPVTNKAELEAWRDRVADMKNRGMSLVEVIPADPTTRFDERWNSWGENFKKRSIGEIYKATP